MNMHSLLSLYCLLHGKFNRTLNEHQFLSSSCIVGYTAINFHLITLTSQTNIIKTCCSLTQRICLV